MDIIIEGLLETTIYSSVMIVMVLGIRAAIGKRIHTGAIMFLWTLVLIRLLLPVTFESSFHLDGIFKDVRQEKASIGQVRTEPVAEEPAAYNYHAAPGNGTPALYETEPMYAAPAEPSLGEKSTLQKIAEEMGRVSLKSVIFAGWLAGLLAVLAKFLKLLIRFKIRMKANRPAGGGLDQMVDCMRIRYNIRRKVRVFESQYIDAPITVGAFRPRILLPVNFARNIGEEKLGMIITHELMHIKRRDIFKNYLWLIAKTIYWFNPLVRLAYNGFIEDMEMLCDESVMRNFKTSKRAVYSQGLLDVIKLSHGQIKLPTAMPFCKNKTKIRKRVENMLKPTKKLKSAVFLSMLLAAVMAAGCFTTACQPTPEEVAVSSKKEDIQDVVINNDEQESPETADNEIALQDD